MTLCVTSSHDTFSSDGKRIVQIGIMANASILKVKGGNKRKSGLELVVCIMEIGCNVRKFTPLTVVANVGLISNRQHQHHCHYRQTLRISTSLPGHWITMAELTSIITVPDRCAIEIFFAKVITSQCFPKMFKVGEGEEMDEEDWWIKFCRIKAVGKNCLQSKL